jgi:glycosyltransferase involved in cell wall biosynthesis
VGGGPEEARLRSMVQKAGIERFVRFTGRVHHEEVARYYGIIDICVFPRHQIRLTDLVTPLKPLEAMARIKPIVASDVGGHRELITDSKTGYLFPAGDVDALAAMLAAVISNPGDAAKVAAQGRKHVETSLNWDVVVQRYGAVYEELLSKKRVN